MKKKRQFDKPSRVRTSEDEKEVLLAMRETVQYAIFKRIATRFVSNLVKIGFNSSELDPGFAIKHSHLTGQVLGIKRLFRFVDKLKNNGRKY